MGNLFQGVQKGNIGLKYEKCIKYNHLFAFVYKVLCCQGIRPFYLEGNFKK